MIARSFHQPFMNTSHAEPEPKSYFRQGGAFHCGSPYLGVSLLLPFVVLHLPLAHDRLFPQVRRRESAVRRLVAAKPGAWRLAVQCAVQSLRRLPLVSKASGWHTHDAAAHAQQRLDDQPVILFVPAENLPSISVYLTRGESRDYGREQRPQNCSGFTSGCHTDCDYDRSLDKASQLKRALGNRPRKLRM
jgi:hypothetical protein